MKKNEGITLIALIITIIILVILTAITINNVIGSDLIGFATKAAENYIDAAEEENKVMQKTVALSAGTAVAEDSIVKAGVIVTDDTESKNTGEGESGIKYNYKDTMGRTAMVPEGFKVSTKPSEQFVEDGLVIQDNDGNEFVWVPCYVGETKPAGTSEDVQKYEKHTYIKTNESDDDTKGVKKDKDNWSTYNYTKYTDWTDEASKDDNSYGNKSVKKYGEFYIGRYEAGWNGNPEIKIQAGTSYVNSYSEAQQHLNVIDQKPVSKKGVFSWNFITQSNAKTVAESMYGDDVTYNGGSNYSDSVQSKLVDGAAWDTVTNWIAKDGVDVTNSIKYGNYNNTGIQYTGLYAKHIWAQHQSPDWTDHWLCAKRFSYGTITLKSEAVTNTSDTGKANDYADTGIENNTNHTYWPRYELPTGSVENFKLKNIYDLAGNMWEWTTEVGNHKETPASSTVSSPVQKNNGSFAVLRGGSFLDDGTPYPLCCRIGHHESTAEMYVNFGFRVVLYVK